MCTGAMSALHTAIRLCCMFSGGERVETCSMECGLNSSKLSGSSCGKGSIINTSAKVFAFIIFRPNFNYIFKEMVKRLFKLERAMSALSKMCLPYCTVYSDVHSHDMFTCCFVCLIWIKDHLQAGFYNTWKYSDIFFLSVTLLKHFLLLSH